MWHCFFLRLCDATQQRGWVTPSHSREMQTLQPFTNAARHFLHQDESAEMLLHPSGAENSHQASTSQSFLGYTVSHCNYWDSEVNAYLSMYALTDTKFLTCREVQRTEKAPKADAICYISTVSIQWEKLSQIHIVNYIRILAWLRCLASIHICVSTQVIKWWNGPSETTFGSHSPSAVPHHGYSMLPTNLSGEIFR